MPRCPAAKSMFVLLSLLPGLSSADPEDAARWNREWTQNSKHN